VLLVFDHCCPLCCNHSTPPLGVLYDLEHLPLVGSCAVVKMGGHGGFHQLHSHHAHTCVACTACLVMVSIDSAW
jgi:hypothetical protein